MLSRSLGIALGAWYLVAPFVWKYTEPLNVWLDVVLGAAVLALSASFLVGASRMAGWLLVGVGASSLLAPFLFGYLELSRPFFNDLFLGVLVIGTAVALGADAVERRARAH